jgi:hypothetical protein
MAEDEPEQPELEAQMEAATKAIRVVVLRLLQEGKVHPQLLILAVPQIAGKLGVSAALASGQEVQVVLGEPADVLQQAGREHHETLQALTLPVAVSA